MNESRSLLGMALQRALLGQVSPQLRGVSVDQDDQQIHLNFFFNGPVSEEDRVAASEVESELLADLPPDKRVETEIVRLDAPKRLPDSGLWVFRRRE